MQLSDHLPKSQNDLLLKKNYISEMFSYLSDDFARWGQPARP